MRLALALMLKHPYTPIIVLVTTCSLWGMSWMPLRYLNGLGVDGLALIFVAHTLLALLFLPFVHFSEFCSINAKYLLGIALAGGMGIFSFTYALMYGDVVRVMVLFYLLPVWGVLGGCFFLGERIDACRWAGIGIALPGAYLILGGANMLDTPPTWYDLLALLAGMSFAVNNILFRGVAHLSLNAKLVAMFIGCAVITGGLMVVGLQPFPTGVAGGAWAWVLLYTVTWLLFANIGSQWAVERMEAGRSSIIIIVQLVVAVLSAMIVGSERLSLSEWLGCALVVTAAVLEAQKTHRERAARTANM